MLGWSHQLCVKRKLLNNVKYVKAIPNGYTDQQVIASGTGNQGVEVRHYYGRRHAHKEAFSTLIHFWFNQITNKGTSLDKIIKCLLEKLISNSKREALGIILVLLC